jgi:hypothetical protein
MSDRNHALRAAAIVILAGGALLVAACGNSRKVVMAVSSGRNSTDQAQLDSAYLRFARCMRSHGVSDFPDPITGSGGHPGFRLEGGSSSGLNSNNPAFQRGIGACQHILGHRFRFTFTPGGAGKGA